VEEALSLEHATTHHPPVVVQTVVVPIPKPVIRKAALSTEAGPVGPAVANPVVEVHNPERAIAHHPQTEVQTVVVLHRKPVTPKPVRSTAAGPPLAPVALLVAEALNQVFVTTLLLPVVAQPAQALEFKLVTLNRAQSPASAEVRPTVVVLVLQ